MAIKVTLAALADGANVSREGKLNILGIFDVIHSQKFPMTHPQMLLVMRFEADFTESASRKKVEIHLMDADGKKMFVLPGEIKLGSGLPGEVIGTNQILTINMARFDAPGTYEFKILVDGEIKSEVPLKVAEISPPA